MHNVDGANPAHVSQQQLHRKDNFPMIQAAYVVDGFIGMLAVYVFVLYIIAVDICIYNIDCISHEFLLPVIFFPQSICWMASSDASSSSPDASALGGDEHWAYSHGFSAKILDVFRHVVRVLGLNPTRVVDVGCGAGPLAVQLAAQMTNVRVTAIDWAENAIQLCAANATRCMVHGRVVPLLHNVSNTLPDDFPKHDAAISAFLLTDKLDPRLAVERIKAMVRPGGLIVLAEWASTPQIRAYQAIDGDLAKFYPHGQPVIGSDNIAKLLQAQGLHVVHRTEIQTKTDMIPLVTEHFDAFLKRLQPPPDPMRLRTKKDKAELQQLFLQIYDPAAKTEDSEDLDVTIAVVVAVVV